MSDVEETKAGHAPAAKVGNMRVPGNRSRNSSNSEKSAAAASGEPSAEELKQQEAEYNSGAVAEQPIQGQIISGAVVSEVKAFTPEAVKAYHEKPQPTHEKSHAPSTHNIHQPRK